MKQKFITYSSVLQDFIKPIVTENETEETYLEKAIAGMLAWNYSLSEKYHLPGYLKMKKSIQDLRIQFPESKSILDLLIKRKAKHFSKYDHYIFKVEVRTKEDGSKTIYVESAPVDKIKSV